MPIRILHIVTNMDRGGLETLLMNCYRHIDRNVVQFDFLVHRYPRAAYDDEIEELGGTIHRLPRLNPFDPRYKKALYDFFNSHPEYRIVHCHLDCMSGIPLSVAKQCGVPVRIAHAHSSNQDKDWKYPLKRFFMRKIPSCATHLFACSDSSGLWMFPKQNFTVIKNGIDTEKFAFDSAVRDEARKELHLAESLTLGHVGRFDQVKNHSFLIDIFSELKKEVPDAVLLLVGKGPLENQMREKVQGLGLADSVLFLGLRSDVNRILQAVDVFVMPSLYEGLGIAAIEAQTSGTFCVFSDTIPKECKLTDHVVFLSLHTSPSLWAEHILSGALPVRKSNAEQIAVKGYDIQSTADDLQDFYIKMW